MHFVFADRLLPKEFAVESQRRGVRLVADHEVHIQPLAIMNHGRPGVRRMLVQAHRKLALVHPGFPDRFAGCLVQADYRLVHLILFRRGKINAVAHQRRRAVAPAGDRCFPDDVFDLAPLGRQTFHKPGLPVGGQPTPVRPVGRGKFRFRSQATGQAQQKRKGKNPVHHVLKSAQSVAESPCPRKVNHPPQSAHPAVGQARSPLLCRGRAVSFEAANRTP